MPAWTALGVKSSSRVAGSSGRSSPVVPPQPPSGASMARTSTRWSRVRTGGAYDAPRAPQGDVLAQSHALAVPDVPVLLQVLRVRDAQAAPARAGGGRAHARRGRAPQ